MRNEEFQSFNILSILEAEDDENENTPAEDTDADTGDTTDGGDSENEDTDGNEEDEFDIDTSIDLDNDDEGEGGDDSPSDTTTSDSSDDSDSSSMDTDEEAVKANTEIFDSLTPEEQLIKIKELKRLYKDLYSSILDIINRMDDMEVYEDTLEYTTRITSDIHNLKDMIGDYFANSFDKKSYIENDIMFNHFLFQVHSISDVIEQLASSKAEMIGKKDLKSNKK